MSGRDLPNVFPLMEGCLIDGRPLIVKNTFFDLGEFSAESPTTSLNRSRSVPCGLSFLGKLGGEQQLLQQHPQHQQLSQQQHSQTLKPSEHSQLEASVRLHRQAHTSVLSSIVPASPVLCASSQANCHPKLLSQCAHPIEGSDAGCLDSLADTSPGSSANIGDDNSDASTSFVHAAACGCSSDGSDDCELELSEGRTTVMIRELPEGFSRLMLEQLLDAEGFAVCCRFIYLPTDMGTGRSFAYAFLDLATPEDATSFRRHFTGFTRWPTPSMKVAAVDWSEAMQGVDQLVERYRNSPLMHPSVPDQHRPCLYHTGCRMSFPRPTKPLKAPRVRTSSKRAKRLPGLRDPALAQ